MNAVTSPFRGPVVDVNASPSTSVDNSQLTSTSTSPPKSSEDKEAITRDTLQATSILVRIGLDKRRNLFPEEREGDLDYDDEGGEFESIPSAIPGAPPN
jgi:hypothetical protein